MNLQALAKSSLLRILFALILMLGALFFTVRQAGTLLERSLHAAFGTHESQFESVWFDWSGDVVAKHVALRPHDPGEAAEVRFERVWLETGWGFFLRNTFDRSLQHARMPRLHLLFGEASVVDGMAVLVPELGPVGPLSGAMFEADGCSKPTAFTRERLAAMGLSPGTTSLEIDHRLDGDAMHIVIALDTPGSSRTQLTRNGRLDTPRETLLGERATPRIESERWSVRDQGFVAARNRFCAAQDGITPREALERHIAAVEGRLQQAGLAVDENAHAFYRRFARSGGEMAFGGEYQPPLSIEESLGSRDEARALARMNATLERDTRAVPIVWRAVPVPGVPAPDETPDVTPVVPPVAQTPPAEPPVAVSVEPPRPVSPMEEPPAATPVAPKPVVPEPVVPEPVVPEPVVPEPVVPKSVEPTQVEPESVTPKPVESPPVAVPPRPTPNGPQIERAPPVAPRPTLTFDDLAKHRGRQVRLWTVHNPPRTVEVLDASGDTVRVRVKLVGGAAEYTVNRSGFLRATLIR